ncbi:MAG: SMI1/KNR4 family protein [Xanthomonadales bacterium]|nr:SMI1/KNR4 family protein [Xanthomonadales bacterium]
MSILNSLKQLDRALLDQGFDARNAIPPSASVADIQQLRVFFGDLLPDSLIEFFRIQDGEDYRGTSFAFGEISGHISPIADVMSSFEERVSAAQRERGLNTSNGTYEAVGPVWPHVWNSRWIPFMLRDGWWIIDLDPASGGVVGQIVVQFPEDQMIRVVAKSLADLFDAQVAGVLRGDRSIEDALE